MSEHPLPHRRQLRDERLHQRSISPQSLTRYHCNGILDRHHRHYTFDKEKKSDTPPVTASVWNVANMVTVGRIIVTPLTAYSIVVGAYDYAFAGLLYAGVSDWLDGFLARRYKLQTVLGSYLDPAADKLLITSTTLSLASQSVIPVWLASVIVARDLAIISGVAVLMYRNQTVSFSKTVGNGGLHQALEPYLISKVNTTFQIVLMFAAVVHAADWGIVSQPYLDSIGLATAVITTASGAVYAHYFWNLPGRN